MKISYLTRLRSKTVKSTRNGSRTRFCPSKTPLAKVATQKSKKGRSHQLGKLGKTQPPPLITRKSWLNRKSSQIYRLLNRIWLATEISMTPKTSAFRKSTTKPRDRQRKAWAFHNRLQCRLCGMMLTSTTTTTMTLTVTTI